MRCLPLFAALAAACGASKPPPTAPLPPDKPAAATPAAPSPEAAEVAKQAEIKPAAPSGPVEIKFPAPQTTVKIVSDGKGKKAPLRYTPKQGARQAVEVAMD